MRLKNEMTVERILSVFPDEPHYYAFTLHTKFMQHCLRYSDNIKGC